MLIQGQVGPIATTSSLAAAQQPNIRLGNVGDVIVSELHGRFYEANYRGNLFSLSLAAAGAATAFTSASTNGTPLIAVYNPAGSGKNLVIVSANYSNVVAASAAGTATFALYLSKPTSAITGTTTAPLNLATLNASGSIATGFVNVALTNQTAAVGAVPLGSYYWATAAGAVQLDGGPMLLDGQVIIPPGGAIALGASSALTSATYIANLIWEEVPI